MSKYLLELKEMLDMCTEESTSESVDILPCSFVSHAVGVCSDTI